MNFFPDFRRKNRRRLFLNPDADASDAEGVAVGADEDEGAVAVLGTEDALCLARI